MKTHPQLILLAAVIALACGVGGAVIALHVLQTVLKI